MPWGRISSSFVLCQLRSVARRTPPCVLWLTTLPYYGTGREFRHLQESPPPFFLPQSLPPLALIMPLRMTSPHFSSAIPGISAAVWALLIVSLALGLWVA